jgi:uncharacterized protein (TIGR02001 family)
MLMKLLFACAAAGLTAPAGAETRAEAPLDLEFTLDAVSDYRFRGISLSDRRPALQPGVTLTHRSGLYASAWPRRSLRTAAPTSSSTWSPAIRARSGR